jgi:hypothetical protein
LKRGVFTYLSPLCLVVAVFALVGCGPIRSGGLLIDASAELSAAQTAEAPKRAPYEYWAADSFLHKAREDFSYAHYETAEVFAGKAVNCARLARAIAERSARKEMGARQFAPEQCRSGAARSRVQSQSADPNKTEPQTRAFAHGRALAAWRR